MSLRTTVLSGVAVVGLVTAVASAGASGGLSPWSVIAAGVTAVAAGVAVDPRLPPLLGADDRPYATSAGFAAIVATYVLVIGSFWWVELDSDDDLALLPWYSPVHGYLVAAAAVFVFGVGFALGRSRAVPVLMAVSLVLAFILAARQENCAGFGCLAQDSRVGAYLASVPVPLLAFVGVGTRWAVEDFRPGASRRSLLGIAVLVVVLVAAAAASSVGLSPA